MTDGGPASPDAGPDLTGPDPAPAFARLYDEHARSLHRYLARRVGEHTAYDLVSETFLIALRRRHSYDPDLSVRGWLFGIATNVLRGHARQEIRALRLAAKAAASAATAAAGTDDRAGDDGWLADRVDAQVLARRLAPALAGLSAEDRDVLLLIAWAGLSTVEVAEALGVPAGTVRSRLHRVRKRLRAGVAASSYSGSDTKEDGDA